jgi:Flp pilus assembly protein TadG
MKMIANSARNSSRHPNRAGYAVVEFVAVLPLFAALMVGMMEMSRVLTVANLLDDAVRKACRTAATPGKVNTDVVSDVNDILSTDNSLPTLSSVTTQNTAGVYITVAPLQSNGTSGPTYGSAASADVSTANPGDKVSVTVTVSTTNALLYWPKTFFYSDTIESQTLSMMRGGN